MRRTHATLAVARELLRVPDRARWSYEIVEKILVDRGSVNRILKRMEQQGWLTSSWEEYEPVVGRPRRHYYRVTAMGVNALGHLLRIDAPKNSPAHAAAVGG